MKHKTLFTRIAAAMLLMPLAGAADDKPKPPAGTFPEHVGQYTLKHPPDHKSFYHFAVSPKDAWWSTYKRPIGIQLFKGVDTCLEVQCDVLIFSSPSEAKQALDSFVKGVESQYYSAKVIQQGKRPNKAGESFQIIERYFTDKDKSPRLARNDAIWTEGTNVIVAESSPGDADDPKIIKRLQELGLKEAPAIDFMNSYPN